MADKESLEDRKQIIINSISPWMPQSPHERKPALEALASICEEVDELKAELDQCLTAHAMLNDKCCAIEEQLLQMHEGLTLVEQENNEIKSHIEVLRAVSAELAKERDELKDRISELEN